MSVNFAKTHNSSSTVRRCVRLTVSVGACVYAFLCAFMCLCLYAHIMLKQCMHCGCHLSSILFYKRAVCLKRPWSSSFMKGKCSHQLLLLSGGASPPSAIFIPSKVHNCWWERPWCSVWRVKDRFQGGEVEQECYTCDIVSPICSWWLLF